MLHHALSVLKRTELKVVLLLLEALYSVLDGGVGKYCKREGRAETT